MIDIDPGKQEGPRPERARSSPHPAFGLATAIQKARLIHEAEQTAPVPFPVAVKHLGFSGPTAPALRTLAALKTYGIMVEEAGHLRFTPDGLVVVMHQEGEQEVLARMAQRPEAFRQILTRYPERLPSDQALKATLVHDYRVSDSTADTIVSSFRETMSLVKELGAVIAAMAQAAPGPAASHVSMEAAPPKDETPLPPAVAAGPPATAYTAYVASAGLLHIWSLGKGVFVEVRANRALTSAQFGLLKKYVELAEQAAALPEPQAT